MANIPQPSTVAFRLIFLSTEPRADVKIHTIRSVTLWLLNVQLQCDSVSIGGVIWDVHVRK